jgi:S1-C subfamily serine protease
MPICGKTSPHHLGKNHGQADDPTPPKSGSTGSGFFVSKLGHVITNAHVVRNCGSITVGDNAKKIVRRHINWNNHRPDLKEDLAPLVQDIKRRICGIASAGSPLFSV